MIRNIFLIIILVGLLTGANSLNDAANEGLDNINHIDLNTGDSELTNVILSSTEIYINALIDIIKVVFKASVNLGGKYGLSLIPLLKWIIYLLTAVIALHLINTFFKVIPYLAVGVYALWEWRKDKKNEKRRSV